MRRRRVQTTYKRTLGVTLPALAVGLMTVLPAWSLAASPRTELLSVPNSGPPIGSQTSTFGGRAVSSNGQRAVFSANDDALPGADGTRDVYLRNRETDKTRLVSRATNGEPANASSSDSPAISPDGRIVAFTTSATNLSGGVPGVFVRNLATRATKLVSRTSEGDAASGSGEQPSLSADGRLVAFEFDSDDLPGTDGTRDAYVRDRKTGRTTLISKSTDGTPADTDVSVGPSISAEGRFVTFRSNSDVLPGADGTGDLFIRDRREGTTSVVSKTSAGAAAGDGFGSAGAVSADGRFVAFVSSAASLGAAPGSSAYLRDRRKGTTRMISRTAQGDAALGDHASISASGRYVSFESNDDDLAGEDATGDVYRHDRLSKAQILVSRSTNGDPGADDSFYPSISAGGGFVAFTSRANNLSDDDDNGFSNTFMRGPLG